MEVISIDRHEEGQFVGHPEDPAHWGDHPGFPCWSIIYRTTTSVVEREVRVYDATDVTPVVVAWISCGSDTPDGTAEQVLMILMKWWIRGRLSA